jgi:large subunit ribosomal protein L17
MRHKVFGKHLGRSTGQRNALRRTLITQFFLNERITTTRAKAEAIRGAAEQMITKAKRALAQDDAANVIHVRRLLNGRLDSPEAVVRVFDVLAPRYAERPGGYTRMFKLGPRKGDAADMVVLEMVDRNQSAATEGESKGVAGAARNLISRVRRPGRRKKDETETKEGSE